MSEETKETNPSETVPGGRYLVNDQLVNAEGVPLKDQGESAGKPQTENPELTEDEPPAETKSKKGK